MEIESLRLDFKLGFFKINASHTNQKLSTLIHPLFNTEQTLSRSHSPSHSHIDPQPLSLTHPLLSLTVLSLSLHSQSPLFHIYRLHQKI